MGHRNIEKVKPRVLLYCPTYTIAGREQIETETRRSIESIKFNGAVDKVINSESKYPPPDYENVLAHYQHARELALDGNYDALFTVEHDIIVPSDGLQKLWSLDVPVAYGVYLFRGSGNVVNAFRMVNAPAPDMSLSIFKDLLRNAVKKGVVEVSGTGSGCTLIRREVLEQIEFRRAENDSPCPDIPFSTDCMRLGIKQYAHFGVQCGHIIDSGTIWLNLENGINMTRITVLQNFIGADGIHYRKDQTVEMDSSLVNDYERAGYIKITGKPWLNSEKRIKSIAIKHHQNKAKPLKNALADAGYKTVSSPIMADALLIDHDIKEYGHRDHVERFYKAGKPVFLYPHGAAPMLCWDGIHEPSGMIKGQFVTSKGHAEVLRRYEYPVKTYEIGWYLTEVRPWQPTDGYRVLFAPIHPIMGHVYMFPEDLEVNRKTFERLLEIDDIDLTVRHIGRLEINGLWQEPGVRIYNGSTDQNIDEILNSDLVISNGTMAYSAIALGIPTIMMNQMTPAREPDIHTLERLDSTSTEKYEKYMRYPFDVDNSDNLKKIMQEACRREPKQWRKRFIGDQFDPANFCNLIEGLTEGD